jgi:hypothetical protein
MTTAGDNVARASAEIIHRTEVPQTARPLDQDKELARQRRQKRPNIEHRTSTRKGIEQRPPFKAPSSNIIIIEQRPSFTAPARPQGGGGGVVLARQRRRHGHDAAYTVAHVAFLVSAWYADSGRAGPGRVSQYGNYSQAYGAVHGAYRASALFDRAGPGRSSRDGS